MAETKVKLKALCSINTGDPEMIKPGQIFTADEKTANELIGLNAAEVVTDAAKQAAADAAKQAADAAKQAAADADKQAADDKAAEQAQLDANAAEDAAKAAAAAVAPKK